MSLRVGLIGFGLSGSVFHAPLIAATRGLELAVVVTADQGRAEAARRGYPGVRVEPSAERLFERSDQLDLVVVASPNHSHAALASHAVELGIPVVVDKPLAPTAAAAMDLVERAERAGVLLTVFQNRRWDSDQLTLRRLIKAGELGDVLRYESRFERWRPQARARAWRQETTPEHGGGVLLDLGSHLIDQALSLFGPVRAVYGEVERRRGGPADDDAFVALEHASGVHSHLWASELTAAPGPRLRVLGTAAAFTVAPIDSQEEVLRTGDRPDGPQPWGVEPESSWGRLHRGPDLVEPVRPERGDWPRFYAELASALSDGLTPPIDPRDAVVVLTILERARSGAG
jgi:predicted dehydrogenase